MNLLIVPSKFIDDAWKDGAHLLGESCVEECTPEQLKFLLAREERVLVRMDDEGETVGWGVYFVQQLPNMRVLFVTNLWARGAHFERFLDQLKDIATRLGCSRIRCAAQEVQERIYRAKIGMKPVYRILELPL